MKRRQFKTCTDLLPPFFVRTLPDPHIRNADLLLLDMIHLPPHTGEDFGRYPGLTFLRQLRLTHGVTTPVVAFTVVSHASVLTQLKELGVADIISKPTRPSELKRRVERVLTAGS